MAQQDPIYLDYNATTPIAKEVADAMIPYLYNHFGNPSSSHSYGQRTKKEVEEARASVARMLGCETSEIIFTSGGTESNNYAIKGAALANRHKGNHIITSAIEHPAVLEVCKWLETQHGFIVTILPVDEYGMVQKEDLEKAITPQTTLISIMHANNEELAMIAKKHGILFHTDAAQSIGKIPVLVNELGVDLLSVAGHKLYAPKGIGALFIRTGVTLEKLMHGASHEQQKRAGTENVLEIAGLRAAADIIIHYLDSNIAHFHKMKEALQMGLVASLGNKAFKVNGHPIHALPNTLSVSFRGVEANTLLSEVGDKVAASAGAACHSESVTVSHVLKAMQVPMDYAMGTIRFSVGRGTTLADITKAVEIISTAVKCLQHRDDNSVDMDIVSSEYKLTKYTHGLGCACKLRPQALEKVLKSLSSPKVVNSNVVVGIETGDDAAVYKISDSMAIISTVDFFTPICDSAYMFGAISAANSMSDVWAMNGKPAFALSVVSFPSTRLPLQVLQDILRGAQDKADEAGVSIVGGHTVDDMEPKFGLAVTGFADLSRIIRNSTAKPGCSLIVTKPLGFGILATAAKQGHLQESEKQELFHWMATLNNKAAMAVDEIGADALTDVTGFGLLGHLMGMTVASKVNARIISAQVPVLGRAKLLAAAGVVPGGTVDNSSYVEPKVSYAASVSRETRLLLADAQTSGGLLICVRSEKETKMLQALTSHGVPNACVIGYTTETGLGTIVVE